MFEPKARNTDPVTSHMAADSAKELARQHHDRIIACLTKHGPAGKDEIAERSGLEANQVARRMAELQKAGLVVLTGRLVQSKSRRAEREWALAIPY